VLTVSAWPATTRLYKLVAKVGQAISCHAPKTGDLISWMERAAAKQGKKLARQAAQTLLDWVGPDMSALDSEIAKLSAYVGGRQTIQGEDIAAVVTAAAGPVAFELANAIAAGQTPAALKALEKMLRVRGDEFRTLGAVAWHLRRALLAQRQIASGVSPRQAVPRMPDPQREAFLQMLGRRGLAVLQADFRRMIQADLAMKSGAEPKAALQELLVALCT
jgi:DNA polymerase-3 subunit delta